MHFNADLIFFPFFDTQDQIIDEQKYREREVEHTISTLQVSAHTHTQSLSLFARIHSPRWLTFTLLGGSHSLSSVAQFSSHTHTQSEIARLERGLHDSAAEYHTLETHAHDLENQMAREKTEKVS